MKSTSVREEADFNYLVFDDLKWNGGHIGHHLKKQEQ